MMGLGPSGKCSLQTLQSRMVDNNSSKISLFLQLLLPTLLLADFRYNVYELQEYFGDDRRVSVSREITKMHEETVRGSIPEVNKHYIENPPKGELVVIVAGKG